MAQSEEFRRLLEAAVYRISLCEGDKPIRVVQDELGYALNKRGGGSAVEYWRQGNLPKMTDVEKLARQIIQRSDLDESWLAQFLHHAGYPYPQELCRHLFPSAVPAPAAPAPATPASAVPAEPSAPLALLPNPAYRSLVGRETLVGEVLAALQDNQGRWIVALDGMGGIGKTALAREVVAQSLKRQLFERVVWISATHSTGQGGAMPADAQTLAPSPNGLTLEGVYNAIALQLGLPGLTQLPEAEKALRIQALLRRQRSLVVLDNLETAADPQALLIDRLYTMLNPSKALCTSRQRFTDQVYAIHLSGLGAQAARQFIQQEAQERRIFSVATAPDQVVGEISEATGGSPLAMKLVVGQLSYLPLQTVLTHLRQAQTLSGVMSGAQETHFYHALYTPAWQLLSASGQQLLIAMSLFIPGSGAPFELIATVSGLSEAEVSAGLKAGWQLSWLETEQATADVNNNAAAASLPLRYYLHPLTAYFLVWAVCQLGEQTQAVDPSQAQDKPSAPASEFFGIFTHCLANALQHLLTQIEDYAALPPPVETRQWAMHLLHYALKLPTLWPLSRQVLVKLAPKMEQAGHRRDWLPYVQQAIVLSRWHADTASAAELQLQAGLLDQLLGDYASAARQLTNAAHDFHALGDPPNHARALNRLAYVARLQRRYGDAERLAYQALAELGPTDPERGSSHTVLGAIALDLQDWARAIDNFRQSLALWQPHGNKRMIARRLRDLGPALRAQKHYAEAMACYEQAILLFGEIEDLTQQAVTQTNLGVVYTEIGLPAQAIALYRQAEPIFRQTYDQRQLAMLFNNLGLAYQAQQQTELAQAAYRQSIAEWQAIGDIAATVTVLDGLGLLYSEQQQYVQAVPIYQQALDLLEKIQGEATTAQLWQEVTKHLDDAMRGET